jgi:acetolactate synthase-1/2/3 large subunit
MPTNAARVLVATLDAHGVDVAYCVPGESYLPVTDAFLEFPHMKLVVCRHEGGAGFMAVAHARLRNEPGVCIISRGPGAMNAAIALHVAYHDAEPVVFLVGQAERDRLGRMALQEMNYSKTFSDTSKLVIEVLDPSQLSESIARAFHIAQSGTPGPVVVVLPEDLLYGDCDAEVQQPRARHTTAPTPEDAAKALDMIRNAQRPVVIAGGRVHGRAALADLTRFAEQFNLPVAPAHRRLHTFDSRHPNCAGRMTNRAPAAQMDLLRTSDLLIVLGERLGPSISQGYTFPRAPVPDQAMIHIWPDPDEVGRIWNPTLGLACDPHEFLKAMLREQPGDVPPARKPFIEALNRVHRELMTWEEVSANDGVVFGRVTRAVDAHLEPDAVVTYDAGNFTGWVNRFINLTQDNMFIGATVGAMGAAVPSGVAAGLSSPGRQIVTFVGDGGAMMTGNELATAMHYGVPIKLFVANNSTFGTIRMHQARSFPGRVTSTALTNPDFAKWGESFGAKGFTIETDADVEPVVKAAMAYDGAVVVEVRTSLNHISPAGRLDQMENA